MTIFLLSLPTLYGNIRKLHDTDRYDKHTPMAPNSALFRSLFGLDGPSPDSPR